MLARMDSPSSVDEVLNTHDSMAQLLANESIMKIDRPQEKPAAGESRASHLPLTQHQLEQELRKARRWNHSTKITKSI